jgi:hypothetical protein
MKREPTYGQHGNARRQRTVDMRVWRQKKAKRNRLWNRAITRKAKKTGYR